MATELTIGQQIVASIGSAKGVHAFAMKAIEFCAHSAPEIEKAASADIVATIRDSGTSRPAVARFMARAVDRWLELHPADRETAASLLRVSA